MLQNDSTLYLSYQEKICRMINVMKSFLYNAPNTKSSEISTQSSSGCQVSYNSLSELFLFLVSRGFNNPSSSLPNKLCSKSSSILSTNVVDAQVTIRVFLKISCLQEKETSYDHMNTGELNDETVFNIILEMFNINSLQSMMIQRILHRFRNNESLKQSMFLTRLLTLCLMREVPNSKEK